MKRMHSVLLAFLAVLVAGGASDVFGQKKPLDHDVYDDRIDQARRSDDGRWALFEIVPRTARQLRVRSVNSDVEHLPRGKTARFTADSGSPCS